MTIIEKIKAKIEILRADTSEFNYQNAVGYNWALDDVLSFLSTLESGKPMTPEKLEEEINKAAKSDIRPEEISDYDFCCIARHFAKWGAEHLADARKTSLNDLDEAANNYLDGVYGKMPHSDYHIAIFIAGAKWQAKRMKDEKEKE